MTAQTVISVIALPVCVAYLIATRRAIRRMRSGDEEWRKRWRQLDPARRKAIRQRMKRGEPVEDPEDAELLVRAVAQIEHVRRAMAPMTIGSGVFLCALLVAGIVSDTPFIVICGVVGLGSGVAFHVVSLLQRRSFERSAAATLRRHQEQPEA